MTTTEENYIKQIYRINPTGITAVSTNEIAAAMNTTAASVTDMVKKLAEKELIIYEKYKGAKLTESGLAKAKQMVRNHRLWEVFLVNVLSFKWDEVHEIAEELEHIDSSKLIAKLEEFLGFPKFDPHGDPIPDSDGNIKSRKQVLLSEIDAGMKCMVLGVKDTSKEFLHYLDTIGVKLGLSFQVTNVFPYDQSMSLLLDNQSVLTISNQVSKNLYVTEV